ncbi:hypothetical protein AMAG_04307 [Allomyces macrogynus ATCC 38327]|uniref:Dystroglycan-type cadherin-like domain-containing protein n=1 Tax=Allomyces macrogynus (strain ATCC 38327) TaxID=578462 RepID=A0A0L0S819_ALLM3|nr:hypothetical protein AMAG_04307 [Allomyces macrogynus ATCC 38327]|eukprot:KNE58753.1 hypothetical protein AMAG_04307 [Allomyces macrogynus ATCC 38327]
MASRTSLSLSSVETARGLQPWRRQQLISWWTCRTVLAIAFALITLLNGVLVIYARPAPQSASPASVTVAIPLLDQLPPPLRVSQPYFFQLHPQTFTATSSSSRIAVSTGTLPSWLVFNTSSWQLVAASVPSLVGASAIAVDFYATTSTARPRTPTASLVIPYTTNTIALANPVIYQWFRATDLPAGAQIVRAALNSSTTTNDVLLMAVDPPTNAPNRVFRLPVPDAPFTATTASGSLATIVSYRVLDVDRGRAPDWATWDDQARSIVLTISSDPALGIFRLALVPSDLPNWTGGPRDTFPVKVGNRAPVWTGPASNATAAPMVMNVTRGNAVNVNVAAWVQDPDKDAVAFTVRPATGQVPPSDMVVSSTTVAIPNVTRSVHLTVTAADVVNATTPAPLDLLVAVDGILPLEVVPRCARVPHGMPCVRLTTSPGAAWSWTVPTGLFVPAAGTTVANFTDDGASYAIQVQAQDSRGGIAVVPILLSAKSDPPADTSMFVTTLVALLTLGGMFVILAALVYKKPWKKMTKLARRDTRRPDADARKTTTSTVSARLEDSFMDVADDDSGAPPVRAGGASGARDSGSIHTLLPPRMAAALIRNSSPASVNASPPHKPTVTFQLPAPSTGGGGTQVVGAWRAGPLLAVPQAAGLDQSFRSHHGSVMEMSATMTSLASKAGGTSPPPHDALAPPAESYYPPVRHSSVRQGLPADRPCLAPFDWEGRRASTLMPPYIADPSSDESGSATSTSRSSTPTSTSVDGIVKMLESGSHETVTKSEATSASTSTSPGGSSSSVTEYEECSSTASKNSASTTESTASLPSSVATPVRLYERAAYWDAMRVSSGSGSQPPTPALPHDLQISVPPSVPAILVTPTSTTSTTLGGLTTRPGPSPTSAKPPPTPVSPIHNPVVRRLVAYPSIPFQYILTLPSGLDQEHVYTAIHPPPSRPPSDLGPPGPVIHSAQSPRPIARDVARMTYPHRFYAAPAAAAHGEDSGVPTPVSALGLTFSNATQLHLPVPWLDMDVDAGRRSGVLRGTPGAADVGEWQVDVFDQVPDRPVWKAVITVKLM